MTELNIRAISVGLIFFVIISALASFGFLIVLASVNDYGVSPLMDIVDDFADDGELGEEDRNLLQEVGESYQDWIYYIDDLWLLLYVVFSIDMFVMAYFSRRTGLFNFLNILYVGLMILLVVLDYVLLVSDWVVQEFFLVMLPFATEILPKFTYWLDHAGIIITIQIVFCLFLNLVDFDMSKFFQQKEKEDRVIQTDEVL